MLQETKHICLFVLILVVIPLIAIANSAERNNEHSQSQASYRLRSAVISSTNIFGSSSEYGMKGILGQSSPSGVSSSNSHNLYAGFSKIAIIRLADTGEHPPIFRSELFQNYPNPFNPATTIEYAVLNAGNVTIKIFNVSGQLVRTLVNEHKEPGRYITSWDGKNDDGRMLATGVYFYRMTINSFVSVKKIVLIR